MSTDLPIRVSGVGVKKVQADGVDAVESPDAERVTRANNRDRSYPSWAWFAAWYLAGCLYSLAVLGMLTIGIFVLPLAVLTTVVLARRHGDASATGLVSGLALPLLYVGYLNRDGPGTVCTTTSTSTSCQDEWSPWPWFAIALALIVVGVALFARARRQRRLHAGAVNA